MFNILLVILIIILLIFFSWLSSFFFGAPFQPSSNKAVEEIIKLADIKKDVIKRDESDMNRSVGALKKAPDAILVDTTKLSIDEVVEKILAYIK